MKTSMKKWYLYEVNIKQESKDNWKYLTTMNSERIHEYTVGTQLQTIRQKGYWMPKGKVLAKQRKPKQASCLFHEVKKKEKQILLLTSTSYIPSKHADLTLFKSKYQTN